MGCTISCSSCAKIKKDKFLEYIKREYPKANIEIDNNFNKDDTFHIILNSENCGDINLWVMKKNPTIEEDIDVFPVSSLLVPYYIFYKFGVIDFIMDPRKIIESNPEEDTKEVIDILLLFGHYIDRNKWAKIVRRLYILNVEKKFVNSNVDMKHVINLLKKMYKGKNVKIQIDDTYILINLIDNKKSSIIIDPKNVLFFDYIDPDKCINSMTHPRVLSSYEEMITYYGYDIFFTAYHYDLFNIEYNIQYKIDPDLKMMYTKYLRDTLYILNINVNEEVLETTLFTCFGKSKLNF